MKFCRTSTKYSYSTHEAMKILGVSKNANAKEIKIAYYEKAKQCHPDLNSGNKELQKKFQEISAAYEFLSNRNITSSQWANNSSGNRSQHQYEEFREHFRDWQHRKNQFKSEAERQKEMENSMKRADKKYFIYLFFRLFFIFSLSTFQYNSYKKEQKIKHDQRNAFESTIANNTNRKIRNERKEFKSVLKPEVKQTKKKKSKKVPQSRTTSVKTDPESTSKYI